MFVKLPWFSLSGDESNGDSEDHPFGFGLTTVYCWSVFPCSGCFC